MEGREGGVGVTRLQVKKSRSLTDSAAATRFLCFTASPPTSFCAGPPLVFSFLETDLGFEKFYFFLLLMWLRLRTMW
ncbi:hypothetical protein BT93_L3928 [Corymbia citriodora subsp. variegata]|uniref:Uncharacterized protein n=1 Tax=Corymbia citriodora subsp. variegata TaxID=360336 RepID=A0A8T0CGL7_CORYI|nr:hypothetical protein BT93_L3928 [Corymbia citriodora subsp. variegata]